MNEMLPLPDDAGYPILALAQHNYAIQFYVDPQRCATIKPHDQGVTIEITDGESYSGPLSEAPTSILAALGRVAVRCYMPEIDHG